VQSFPLALASCSLDDTAMRAQRDRYRAVGRVSTVVGRDARRRVIRVGDDVPGALVEELIRVERACCPFFELGWDAADRLLTISVATDEHEPALEAIDSALGATPIAPS
jgi:hypothetical protein